MGAATVVRVLHDLFYVLLHVLFYFTCDHFFRLPGNVMATSRSQVRRPNHYTTEPRYKDEQRPWPRNMQHDCYNQLILQRTAERAVHAVLRLVVKY